MVDLPNDQGWSYRPEGRPVRNRALPLLRRRNSQRAARIEENLFNLTACKTAEDVFSFAKRWGPWDGGLTRSFDGYPARVSSTTSERYYVFIADREDPDNVEVERMERVIERVS